MRQAETKSINAMDSVESVLKPSRLYEQAFIALF